MTTNKHTFAQSITRPISAVVAVTCSTVTIAKCRAALHTLKKFPYFNPTCLCKEPSVEPECNQFAKLIFEHPCDRGNKKGEPVRGRRAAASVTLTVVSFLADFHDALPSCSTAIASCKRDSSCSAKLANFQESCKNRGSTCIMENR